MTECAAESSESSLNNNHPHIKQRPKKDMTEPSSCTGSQDNFDAKSDTDAPCHPHSSASSTCSVDSGSNASINATGQKVFWTESGGSGGLTVIPKSFEDHSVGVDHDHNNQPVMSIRRIDSGESKTKGKALRALTIIGGTSSRPSSGNESHTPPTYGDFGESPRSVSSGGLVVEPLSPPSANVSSSRGFKILLGDDERLSASDITRVSSSGIVLPIVDSTSFLNRKASDVGLVSQTSLLGMEAMKRRGSHDIANGSKSPHNLAAHNQRMYQGGTGRMSIPMPKLLTSDSRHERISDPLALHSPDFPAPNLGQKESRISMPSFILGSEEDDDEDDDHFAAQNRGLPARITPNRLFNMGSHSSSDEAKASNTSGNSIKSGGSNSTHSSVHSGTSLYYRCSDDPLVPWLEDPSSSAPAAEREAPREPVVGSSNTGIEIETAPWMSASSNPSASRSGMGAAASILRRGAGACRPPITAKDITPSMMSEENLWTGVEINRKDSITRAADFAQAGFQRVNTGDMQVLCQPKVHKVKKIGNYLMGGVLGEGSFGKVKECMDSDTLLRMAVKIFKVQILRKKIANVEQMIYSEISFMQKLQHPNIINLFNISTKPEKEKLYLFMDYCVGSLQTMLNGCVGNRFPDWQAHQYFCQLIEGLNYLHGVGVVHCDIKPGNLLLAVDDTIRITDFGEAIQLDRFSGKDICRVSPGTPNFQAPEVASGCVDVRGFPVDLWAAGVTLYNMISGRYPFEGETVLLLYENVSSAPLKMPCVEGVLVGPELELLLTGILEKDPDSRMKMVEIYRTKWFQRQPAISGDTKVAMSRREPTGVVNNPGDTPAYMLYPYFEVLYPKVLHDEPMETWDGLGQRKVSVWSCGNFQDFDNPGPQYTDSPPANHGQGLRDRDETFSSIIDDEDSDEEALMFTVRKAPNASCPTAVGAPNKLSFSGPFPPLTVQGSIETDEDEDSFPPLFHIGADKVPLPNLPPLSHIDSSHNSHSTSNTSANSSASFQSCTTRESMSKNVSVISGQSHTNLSESSGHSSVRGSAPPRKNANVFLVPRTIAELQSAGTPSNSVSNSKNGNARLRGPLLQKDNGELHVTSHSGASSRARPPTPPASRGSSELGSCDTKTSTTPDKSKTNKKHHESGQKCRIQ